MRVSATQRVTDFTVAGVFLVFVFLLVIVAHSAVTGALRNAGLQGGTALLISGAIVFGVVVGGWALYQGYLALDRRRADAERERMGLPDGPCCVVWRGSGEEADMPWALDAPVRVGFPMIARRFGIEGFAIVDFNVTPEGQVTSVHCVDVWPAPIFYEAAAAALKDVRFKARPGAAPRFGPSFRMPFVFRIRGAAKVRDKGKRAKRRPVA
jgi:TonB family protein